MEQRTQAQAFLTAFKGDSYVYGLGCLDRLGDMASQLGLRATVVAGGTGKDWGARLRETARESLAAAGVQIAGDIVPGARPNTPVEDVHRIAASIGEQQPDVLVAMGGGSVIDATKAASALATLGGSLDGFFGVGKATERAAGRTLTPLLAVQVASGSAAHLTRYANVTDMAAAQKKLIVDDAVVPDRAVFDYALTRTMSPGFTADGGLDGVAHSLEVLYGAKGNVLDRVRPVALLGIELIVANIRRACSDPGDLDAREALGLGTDLGGYAIMIGGTNGGHLTSFSLVDVLPHGRACALMNPYYTVFFAPAIEPQLRDLAELFARVGYLGDTSTLHGRDLGVAVAEAMLALSRDIDFPTTLAEVEGFTDTHIKRALEAAKNPQLEMKLRNMPVPLSAETVDDLMGPIIEAAKTGDFSLI
jgi:alcohol dehydrogenase class IV